MSYHIRQMTIDDYDHVIQLWQASDGIGLSEADSRESIQDYLTHNPRMSFCAWEGADLVGAVLCGHDSRRGYLHHLAVQKSHRRQGIGKALVEACLSALQEIGIAKCHIFVYQANQEGLAFWERCGWTLRTELVIMSKDLPGPL